MSVSHVPFRHAKQIEVQGKDQVLVDYDEDEQQYVAFFTDNMVCRVNKTVSFKSKADLDSYLQQFCNQKPLQYGRIRFRLRIGRRIVFMRDYSLSTWNPDTAKMDFMDLCRKEHKRAYQAASSSVEMGYTM